MFLDLISFKILCYDAFVSSSESIIDFFNGCVTVWIYVLLRCIFTQGENAVCRLQDVSHCAYACGMCACLRQTRALVNIVERTYLGLNVID